MEFEKIKTSTLLQESGSSVVDQPWDTGTDDNSNLHLILLGRDLVTHSTRLPGNWTLGGGRFDNSFEKCFLGDW